ncbi:MAG TPA: DUF4954 family protein [Bacteroidales bacterium]|jgi:hypothetical protein|nr:DUF4954 family protein [Bacteroidales bacterium]
MNDITRKPLQSLGYNFIPDQYLPSGKDEYYLRNKQNPPDNRYRQLSAHEIEVLVRNRNTTDNWNNILVTQAFNPELVKNSKFFGLVRIGKLEPWFLEFHDLQVPVGIYNSTIVSCDFGDNVVIDNVNYLSHYIIGNEVIITNVHEIDSTNHAKFGNGILKEGESESVRIYLEICNENGGRSILPFDGILPGDAWLWSRSRHQKALQQRFREMTEKQFDNLWGYYSTIGDRAVIKNCSIIKDVKIGADAYIKGANKLKNLTVNSSPDHPTQIGEGCELVNGIIGKGCKIFYGVKAVRFVLGANSQLKYGARLINSFLGENSTISCCEVLNSLIFPAHEQHHNNSFLIAATIEGTSNIAAGATLGSNHNSRSPDGEIIAGRGFWPALTASIKHNSRFAPFTLLAKGDYPNELNITFPFSLVNNNIADNQLEVMPGYWFMYNMYALARNSWKLSDRDKRPDKIQWLEFDYLAPDTVNLMMESLKLLEKYTGRAVSGTKQCNDIPDTEKCIEKGKELLSSSSFPEELLVLADGIEHSQRSCVILKPQKAWKIFREMIEYYITENLLSSIDDTKGPDLAALNTMLVKNVPVSLWLNVGGQLIKAVEIENLRKQITDYEVISWDQVHAFYAQQGKKYRHDKLEHALSTLRELSGIEKLDAALMIRLLNNHIESSKKIVSAIRESRLKDYTNPFRRQVYENFDEMEAVIGKIDDTSFIIQQEAELKEKINRIDNLIKILS